MDLFMLEIIKKYFEEHPDKEFVIVDTEVRIPDKKGDE